MSLRLLNLWHEIELLEAEKERITPGGIALPESWWGKQDATALVLSSGPGLPLDCGAVLPPMVQPGDLVLLDYGDFHPLQEDGPGARSGFVWEGQLVGWLAPDLEESAKDRIVPLNDWVLVEIDDRPKQAGSLALTDKARRPQSGTVLDVGPGRLLTRGPHRGTRLPMPELVGRRVYWDDAASVICAGRFSLQWVLIRASDLICAEDGVEQLCTACGVIYTGNSYGWCGCLGVAAGSPR